jgi:2'-5' RNA ligase
MRYLIALPIRPEESVEFIKLRDQYKHFAPKWKITLGPHITLFRPSEYKIEQKKAIEIFKKAPHFESFKEEFVGFEAFLNHSNNAVFAEPSDYDNFKKLKRLYEATATNILQDTTEVWPFHPHLTLINRLDSENAQLALKNLAAIKFEASYTFDRVYLYKKAGSDKEWIEIASNSLTRP